MKTSMVEEGTMKFLVFEAREEILRKNMPNREILNIFDQQGDVGDQASLKIE